MKLILKILQMRRCLVEDKVPTLSTVILQMIVMIMMLGKFLALWHVFSYTLENDLIVILEVRETVNK